MITTDWTLITLMLSIVIIYMSHKCYLVDLDRNEKDLKGHIRTIEGNQITIERLLNIIEEQDGTISMYQGFVKDVYKNTPIDAGTSDREQRKN